MMAGKLENAARLSSVKNHKNSQGGQHEIVSVDDVGGRYGHRFPMSCCPVRGAPKSIVVMPPDKAMWGLHWAWERLLRSWGQGKLNLTIKILLYFARISSLSICLELPWDCRRQVDCRRSRFLCDSQRTRSLKWHRAISAVALWENHEMSQQGPNQGREQAQTRHSGCSLTGSHNTAKCKYYMRNHMELPSGVSVQELLVLPVVVGQWATTEQCELEPWASVSSWALGMLLLVLFWVPQLGAGFGNPSNTPCRNRWFLLVWLKHFPFLINI